ncbi:MAG: translation elongation factor 4 [Candidatus Pacebacteria bacterium]|nr:translation elongation factor 4 [Candidatus Paceibacterota bacterium]
MSLDHIRNFSIIAHIDHGKSTLADRMLEITHTIEKRKMQDQVLDSMELERERGITIKMQPVRMSMHSNRPEHSEGQDYVLNLIDTPGHIDFSYEVSRALKAVEGSILLVDATQGVQAQTLTTLEMAKASGLVIIPVVSKIDSPLARADEVKLEIAKVLDCDPDQVLEVSGRTGVGVAELLEAVINRIPPPHVTHTGPQDFSALVFDFEYSNHQGVIVYIRVLNGTIRKGDQLLFSIANEKFQALSVGTFAPVKSEQPALSAGEIGYIVTGIKQPGIASVGDTITFLKNPLPALPGYQNPRPVVWASVYPESQDAFTDLKYALARLRLSDSAFSYEEETSGALGRGFRCGFLGMLHLEIITERLRREYSLDLVVTQPSITYQVRLKNGEERTVYSPHMFPGDGEIAEVFEPWVTLHVMTPNQYLGGLSNLFHDHEGEVMNMENFGEDRTKLDVLMPLRELMRNFFDDLKSVTSGYASIAYDFAEMRSADVTRLDILIADEVIAAFTRVIARRRAAEEAETAVDKLHEVMPRQMFEAKIQGYALGRILASKTIKAFRKDVTQHMYGGDITRKMKLREKQKKGKKKMQDRGKVNIPHDVFLKMMKK